MSSEGEIQAVQTRHRQKLVESWSLASGSRVLELGCGQGDMTSVLAEAVGPDGFVAAVDIADPSYGAPFTLGQATDAIKASAVGRRIDFHFNFDILNPQNAFDQDSFDSLVLAHSSWYFASIQELVDTLRVVRGFAKKLLFAEWDMEPQSIEQMGHLLAIFIQGQVEAFKADSLANVRSPLTRNQLLMVLEQSGWAVTKASTIEDRQLQDADWEINACLASSLSEAESLGLPSKFTSILESQIEILKHLATSHGNRPLSCYSLVAERVS